MFQPEQATLTIGGRTFKTGDTVITVYGQGIIRSFDPLGDQEICVKLFTPVDIGSVFWFSFNEVAVEPAE